MRGQWATATAPLTIAADAGEQRVTMPAMKMGVIALLLVAAGLSACAGGTGTGSASGVRAARVARAEASHALKAVTKLQHQLRGMQRRLDTAHETSDAMREHLGTMSDGLWAALSKLRTSMGDVKGQVDAAAGAQATASSALDKALQISRDLSVLQQRFDYHLRHSGGA